MLVAFFWRHLILSHAAVSNLFYGPWL
jgi:hypothetical protein